MSMRAISAAASRAAFRVLSARVGSAAAFGLASFFVLGAEPAELGPAPPDCGVLPACGVLPDCGCLPAFFDAPLELAAAAACFATSSGFSRRHSVRSNLGGEPEPAVSLKSRLMKISVSRYLSLWLRSGSNMPECFRRPTVQ